MSAALVIGDSLLSAVRPMVSVSATNAEISAHQVRHLGGDEPGGSWRCSHIWLSASRRLAIHPRPAHAAVASPMTPTVPREAIAESINSTSWDPRSPDTADRMRSSTSAIRSGWLASTNPPMEKPTISSGNNAKMVKYVMPAA